MNAILPFLTKSSCGLGSNEECYRCCFLPCDSLRLHWKNTMPVGPYSVPPSIPVLWREQKPRRFDNWKFTLVLSRVYFYRNGCYHQVREGAWLEFKSRTDPCPNFRFPPDFVNFLILLGDTFGQKKQDHTFCCVFRHLRDFPPTPFANVRKLTRKAQQ